MALEYLKTLGKAKSDLMNVEVSPVGKVAQEFAQDMINTMKNKLAPRNATGNLSQSIIPEFKGGEGGVVEFDVLMADYWDFINSGVNGTQNTFGSAYSFSELAKTQSSGLNFKESLTLWMASKGIVADDGDQDSLAFVIMQSVKQKGITPTPFVNETLTEARIKQFEEDLLNAFNSMV